MKTIHNAIGKYIILLSKVSNPYKYREANPSVRVVCLI